MPNPLKTIIWKELRENLKWAVLALLCLTVAETYALYQGRNQMHSYRDDVTLCSQAFALVAMLGCALVGAGLGAIQILPELRRDQWAALLHRPVPRSTIFLGKVIAGLLLYLLATAGPLLISVIYVALPGQFPAPFIPRMILPAASNVAFGVAFYSVSLLVSLTRGRWYGRRAILALSVAPLFLFHLFSNWTFVPPLGLSLILLTAAGGVMSGNGSVSRGLKAARFSFVFAMFLGVQSSLCLLYLAINCIPGAGSHLPPDFRFRNFVLAPDGKIFVSSVGSNDSSRTLTNVDGTPVTDERYLGGDAEFDVRMLSFLFWDLKGDRARSIRAAAQTPRSLEHYLRIAHGEEEDGPEYWYYLVGKDYFVGYDKLSRRCIGICDRGGFHPAGSVPKPFPTPWQTEPFSQFLPHLYWAGHQLYEIDFADRAITPLFTAPNSEIYTATGLAPGRQMFYIVMALEKELQILDLRGAPVVTIPYSHDVNIWSAVSIGTIPSADRIFVQYTPDYRFVDKPGETPKLTYLDEVDLQGKVVHSYSGDFENAIIVSGWGQYGLLAVSPLVPALPLTMVASDSPEETDSPWSNPFHQLGFRSLPWVFAVFLGISLALGVIAYLWARRAGFSEREARRWALFVFCLGVPGLVTFRLAAGWPTRVACPACSHQRPIETEECPACHQAWPPPASNGTEILVAP